MNSRATEAAGVGALALVLTLMIAISVLRAPSERIFGMAIVGRHYDPFTVMEQFNQPIRWTAFLQPITDVPGAVLAKYVGVVASYNVLVLLSFPLAAIAAYLLARHCGLAPASACGVALAVAFSPFHIAQAAYHPQVAQVQWLPLYLLALWRCLDGPSIKAIAWLALATVAVTLSNFYGGFIAAVITPVSMAAYWLFNMRRAPAPLRRLAITSSVLVALAIAGVIYAAVVAGEVLRGSAAVEFASGDLLKYGATWWRYVVPPAAHPWLGVGIADIANPRLLEQQLSLGWGLIVLSGVAVAAWFRERASSALTAVPVLATVAIVALWCSLSPTTVIYRFLPMFRAYARFGGVVQLMIALLAGLGAQSLWHSGARRARVAVIALVMLAAAEYAVWPPTLSRDVLPTAAHRWIAQQPASVRALDCYPFSPESQSVQWLTGGRVILRARSVNDCREPGVIAALSATGFTHMLIRRNTPEGRWFEGRPPPSGLQLAARFGDAEVFSVTERPSLIRTVQTAAFYPVEFDEAWTWRWMGPQASWTIVNSSARALMASVDLETNAFHAPRRLTVILDGAEVQDVVIEAQRAIRRIGPLTLRPGDHTLTFRAAPAVADDLIHNGDPRPLSVAFGDWRWSVDGDER